MGGGGPDALGAGKIDEVEFADLEGLALALLALRFRALDVLQLRRSREHIG